MLKHDYSTLRSKTRFNWHANSSYYVLLPITGISLYDLNTNPEAAVQLFKPENRMAVKEIFGEDTSVPGITTPKISYGHINCLGFDLSFPKEGEVNYVFMEKTLEQWSRLLKDTMDIDFSTQGMFPFYKKYWKILKSAYPEENVGFGFDNQGPMTTAYELRGMEAFTDPLDFPGEFKQFMDLVVESIIRFIKTCAKIHGKPFVKGSSAQLLDDLASVFAPYMWSEFVIPYWNKYFCQLTDGIRRVHVEDLSPNHLPHLEDALISSYDPGISHKLNPKIVYEKTRVPFDWRMGAFHMRDLDVSEISDWVYKAAADGASTVFTTIPPDIGDKDMIEKVKIFRNTCRKVEKILNGGACRQDLYKYVSPEGMEKFWDKWSYK